MNFFYNYILFIAKSITVMISIITTFFLINNFTKQKKNQDGSIKITVLETNFNEIKNNILLSKMSLLEKKIWKKEEKQRIKNKINKEKLEVKNNIKINKPTLYVLDFKGSIQAKEVSNLRKEISAIISVAQKNDEVLLRLESSGGVVHGYGLAASQLERLKKENIYLTIVVDKIAASGGYMMACVANHIVAAPFAIIGSIGVVSQFPNFNKLLKKNNIDIELHTAGIHKRNITMFGENTELGRKKLCDDLEQTHILFKNFIQSMRPSLNINSVANGDHWFGSIALEKKLIDSINTSDDVIFSKKNKFQIIKIQYCRNKKYFDFCFNGIINYIFKIYNKLFL
ncbi:Probable protease SohB [Buchnera aphidicola (Eriosoma lanigerum)]|uniref:protease SohB n=1 Tax=Buchnera aphidicola TaxID=9 RepID=UPI0034645788